MLVHKTLHSNVYSDYSRLGCDAIFWDSSLFSSSPLPCLSWDRNPISLKMPVYVPTLCIVPLAWTGLYLLLPPTDLLCNLPNNHTCTWLTHSVPEEGQKTSSSKTLVSTDKTRWYHNQDHNLNSCYIQMHLYILYANLTKFQIVQKCSLDYNVPLPHNTNSEYSLSQTVVLIKKHVSQGLWRF